MHNEQNERQPLNQGPGKLTDYMAIQIIYKTHKKDDKLSLELPNIECVLERCYATKYEYFELLEHIVISSVFINLQHSLIAKIDFFIVCVTGRLFSTDKHMQNISVNIK